MNYPKKSHRKTKTLYQYKPEGSNTGFVKHLEEPTDYNPD